MRLFIVTKGFLGWKNFYLLPQLKGPAKQPSEGLLITDENYTAAIDILKLRFDRSDDRIVSMLYGELKQLPRSSGRIDDKRRTFDTCERIFRQLMLANEDIDSSRALTMDLLSKFPAQMVRELQRFYDVGVHSKLSDVRVGIEKSLSELETTTGIINDLDAIGLAAGGKQKISSNGNKEQNSPNDQQESSSNFAEAAFPEYDDTNERTSAFSAVAETNPSNPRGKSPHSAPASSCYFCNGHHFNGECTKYPSAKSRVQRLYELKRCIKCGRNHNAGGKREQCNNTTVKCVHCKSQNDHYSALCQVHYPVQSDKQTTPSSSNKGGSRSDHSQAFVAVEQTNDVTILNNTGAKNSLFQTAKVEAINSETGAKHVIRMCLDTLSNRSYITDKAAENLQLSTEKEGRLLVSVFGSQKSVEVPTRLVEFGVIQWDGSVRSIVANTTKIISNSSVLPSSWPKIEKELLNSMKRSQTLADDPFDDNTSIDVLIGADYAWEFITGSKINTATGIYFVPSTVGLMLAGKLSSTDMVNDHASTMLCITETPRLQSFELSAFESAFETKLTMNQPDIDEYWSLETIGITDSPTENNDEKAENKFRETVVYKGGRYHVTWPWIDEKKCLLPMNYDVALRRFNSLATRLKLNPDLLQGYKDVIKLHVERGIIEKVPLDQDNTSNSIHYLPHHPVVKSSSATTKIRIVYDASSKLKKDDVSLNECLILPDLCQLLMRFRCHKIAVVSDIEKAFLQVALQRTERDVTRFLWFDDDSVMNTSGNIATYRFCRVAFGIISSSFLLGATIQIHLDIENTPLSKSLKDDFYVDNLISGLENDSDLPQYYESIKQLLGKAGMNLQEFCSNSSQLVEVIPARQLVKNTDVKVLGIKWDSQKDDTIRICESPKLEVSHNNPTTKRSVLQAVASVFDPLGLFQPILFPAKLFLQKLWLLDLTWDTQINVELIDEWREIARSMQDIFEHRIPRFAGKISAESTLVVFSDASAKGYGAAVYLRCRNVDETWSTNLIFAKSRLAPLPGGSKCKSKTPSVTLPRLELLAATIAANAVVFCRDAFKMSKLQVQFFIDSECVLHWIRSTQNLKRFVARRVDTIREIHNATFHYVNTSDNPADYLSRGKTSRELQSDDTLWWHGPKWLAKEATHWPETRLDSCTTEDVLKQVAAEVKVTEIGHTLAVTDVQPIDDNDVLTGVLGIDPKKFSSFKRLINVTSYCLKFLRKQVWENLPDIRRENSSLNRIFEPMNSEDVNVTTMLRVRHVQTTEYEDLLRSMRGEGKRNCLINQLGLQIDTEGLIRTHSRFANADLPEEAKCPLLLAKDHHFSVLVVDDVHQGIRHSGVSHTLNQVRQKFWIPRGRAFVKKVLRRCQICRILKNALPFALPNMPPWPIERMSRSVPFQFTGLDYFGPIKVKVNDSIEKMWACLFICLATRAVHVEAVMDCTTAEFLKSLIRFISRRGCPQQIISDNAAQFQLVSILANRAWLQVPTDDSVLSYSAHSRIKWKFIIELAPWQGGHYERLVGVVKSVLKTAIGRRLLSWTDLVTLLTETEAIVNTRPITYVGEDIDSHFRILRPIDFLVERPISIAAGEGDFPTRDLGDSGKRLAAMWKQRKRHLDKLWQHWREEYLLSLRERGKAVHKGSRGQLTRSPREGEVVLIQDKDLPRGSWRLARIHELIAGSDGEIRGARIKLVNGVELRRSVSALIPLEVDSPFDSGNGDSPDQQQGIGDNSVDDDHNFSGCTPDEVQRAIDAVQRYRDLSDNGSECQNFSRIRSRMSTEY